MNLSSRADHLDREVRTFDVEMRAVAEGRTIEGLAAPFDAPTTITDALGEYTETISRGAFAQTINTRGGKIKLLANHDRQSFPLGSIPKLWETAEGLRMEAVVANTTAGTDALTLVSERVVMGLSIGFQVVRQTWNEDYTARQLDEVKLLEISLVSEPAYATAGVTAMRSLGVTASELNEAIFAAQNESADAEQRALLNRAHMTISNLIAPPAPAEVPQSIREDMARLYAVGADIAAGRMTSTLLKPLVSGVDDGHDDAINDGPEDAEAETECCPMCGQATSGMTIGGGIGAGGGMQGANSAYAGHVDQRLTTYLPTNATHISGVHVLQGDPKVKAKIGSNEVQAPVSVTQGDPKTGSMIDGQDVTVHLDGLEHIHNPLSSNF